MKKRIISLLLCVMMLLPVLCGAAMAEEEMPENSMHWTNDILWITKDGKLYYQYADGSSGTGWQQLPWTGGELQWFYFDEDGAAHTGWLWDNGSWYYLSPQSYTMRTGMVEIDGKTYYFEENGRLVQNRWTKSDTPELAEVLPRYKPDWWYSDADGTVHTGWLLYNGRWYYLDGNNYNHMVYGKRVINGVPYFFTDTGAMATTSEEANNLYNITDSGAIATGWQYVHGHWDYYYANGESPEGWKLINGKWYFFRYWMMEDTVVSTDWFKGPYYYVDKNGVADDEPYTGWFKGSFGLSSGWQYYNNGVPTNGWLYDNGKWYYFMPGSGDLLQNTWSEIDGVRYLFSPSGALASGWQYCKMWWWIENTEPNRWYYADEKGVIQTGWLKDNGKWYYLDPELDGGMVTGWLKRGSNWYYMDASGAMVTGTKTIDGKTYTFDANGVWVK